MGETRADPQRAFRAGLGAPEEPGAGRPGLAEAAAGWAFGPNEAVMLAMRRLPGLADAKAAFETGRALRIIARLLDQARAPALVGEQFRDNVAAAVIAHAARPGAPPWSAEDTVAMFVELYCRGLGPAAAEPQQLATTLLRWVRQELAPLPGARRRPSPGPYRMLERAA